MSYIFAQGDTIHAGWLALIVPISGLIGSAGAWLLQYLQKRKEANAAEREQERKDKREDDDRTIEGLEKLNARLDNERRIQDERNSQLTSQLGNARIMNARMIVWIRHLEELSRNAGVKFRPWDEVVKETRDLHVTDSGEFDTTEAAP